MIIKQDKDIARLAQFNEEIINDKPEAWQFKTLYDGVNLGIEFLWDYPDATFNDKSNEYFTIVSDQLFEVNLGDYYIKTSAGYNLVVLPHHNILNDDAPLAIPQVIESDWWPGEIKILFKRKKCEFKHKQPFAQAISAPRRNYQLDIMHPEDILVKKKAREHMNNNKDEYITRSESFDDYPTQDNLYARMVYMQRRGELPKEIQPQNNIQLKMYKKP